MYTKGLGQLTHRRRVRLYGRRLMENPTRGIELGEPLPFLTTLSGGSWSAISAAHPFEPGVVGVHRLGDSLRLALEPIDPVPKL
jgi:hypothetical protein